MPPTLANGKICYIEIPTLDVERSIEFYQAVFGWQVRHRGDGKPAFDDGVGQVSGTWVTGRPASSEAGLLIYIMCDSVAATIDAIVARAVEPGPVGLDPAGEPFGVAPSRWLRFASLEQPLSKGPANAIGALDRPHPVRP